jgi:hypothetical protein
MDYIGEFYNNLGNKNTAILIAFLTGFTIGVLKFGGSSAMMGFLIGLVFAVIAGLITGFIHVVLPDTVNVPVRIKPLFTVCLLILFFFVITSSPTLDQFFIEIGKKIEK